jgi:hypothetical protein
MTTNLLAPEAERSVCQWARCWLRGCTPTNGRSLKPHLASLSELPWSVRVLLLACLISFGTVSTNQAQDYIWTTNAGTITISGYAGPGGNINIPASINGLPVTSLGPGAFAYNADLSGVTIPDSIIDIGQDAFRYCENMTNVVVGDSVTSIEEGAFGFCASLISLILPEGLTNIGNLAFAGCESVPSFVIPQNVASIGYGAFLYCTALHSIMVDPLNLFYESLDGVLFNQDETTLLAYPPGKGDSYSIPPNTLTVGQYAFYRCTTLTNVAIPDTVTSIERFAFRNCRDLTSVTIPTNVVNIGDAALADCDSLIEITIPASVASIGTGAFSGCSNLTTIGVEPENSNYTSVDGVLFDSSLSLLLQYPAGKSGSYTIPAGVRVIGQSAFGGCYNLTGISIPVGVTNIPNWAFDFCYSLTDVVIPDTVTSIGYCAFRFCRSLSSVTIGRNVLSISSVAFGGCYALDEVYCTGDAPSVGDYAFDGDDKATIYYLPGTTGWGSTLGGRPTALWLPKMEFAGMEANQFGFTISWVDGRTVAVDASPGLFEPSWTPITTNTFVGDSLDFTDPEWTNPPSRFYRIRWP